MTSGDGVRGLRERRKAQTREEIVAAAVDLFERNGYDNTTVDDIAAAADVSPRTFFRYFDAKVDVVMSGKQERGDDDDFGARLAERPQGEGPVEATRQVIRTAFGRLAEDPAAVRRMRVMLGTPSLQALARDHFNEHHDAMAADFAARMGVADDHLRAHVVASVVGDTIWTVVARWVAEDGSADRLLEMIDEGFDILASGLDRADRRDRLAGA